MYNEGQILRYKYPSYVQEVKRLDGVLTTVSFRLKRPDTLFAFIQVQQLAHNCGALYMGGLQDCCPPSFFEKAFDVVKAAATIGNYSAVYTTLSAKGAGTVRSSPAFKALKALGFKKLAGSGVKNERTGNTIYQFIYKV